MVASRLTATLMLKHVHRIYSCHGCANIHCFHFAHHISRFVSIHSFNRQSRAWGPLWRPLLHRFESWPVWQMSWAARCKNKLAWTTYETSSGIQHQPTGLNSFKSVFMSIVMPALVFDRKQSMNTLYSSVSQDSHLCFLHVKAGLLKRHWACQPEHTYHSCLLEKDGDDCGWARELILDSSKPTGHILATHLVLNRMIEPSYFTSVLQSRHSPSSDQQSWKYILLY